MNAVMLLTDEEAAKGVVTHSSGNHAQAVALAARERGIPAHIVMPENAPSVKRDAVAELGATVTLCASNGAARAAAAAEVQRRTGATFVHPSNDPRVMAGQGTMAIELLEQVADALGARTSGGRGSDDAATAGDARRPPLDAVVVPVGGGGMLSGVATAVKGLFPGVLVLGAEPAAADDAFRSKQAGELLGHDSPPDTVADGLRTTLGSENFPIVRDLVDEILLVSERSIEEEMRHVFARMKLAIEPSAAVGVAALMTPEFARLRDKHGLQRVGVVLCGGNVDLDKLPWVHG